MIYPETTFDVLFDQAVDELERTNKKTQISELIIMLKQGWVSPAAAMTEIGCYRLSARIWDIKRMGYTIESRIVKQKNRFGHYIAFKEYRIKEEQHERI